MLLDSKQIEEFEKLIENYQPNKEALEIFLKSNFIVIAGPAGAGKDTLRNTLIKNYPKRYLPILSSTTRPIRETEKNGVDYHFISVQEMKRELEKQEFLQVALVHNQQVSAMHVNEIKKLSAGQVGLSILIVQTEKELRELKPNIQTIFLVPPSLEELISRLQANRKLDESEVKRRLFAAKKELEIALQEDTYYCLETKTKEDTLQKAQEYLQGKDSKGIDESARTKMRELIDALNKRAVV